MSVTNTGDSTHSIASFHTLTIKIFLLTNLYLMITADHTFTQTVIQPFPYVHFAQNSSQKLFTEMFTKSETQISDTWTYGTAYAKNPLRMFPRNFPVDGEVANLLRTCCGLVSNTANKSATSRCNEIWETTQQTQRTFARANLLFMLRTCCGLATGKSPTCYRLATGKLL